MAVKSDTVALPPVVDQYNTVPFATFAVLAVKVPDEPSFIVAGTDENVYAGIVIGSTDVSEI